MQSWLNPRPRSLHKQTASYITHSCPKPSAFIKRNLPIFLSKIASLFYSGKKFNMSKLSLTLFEMLDSSKVDTNNSTNSKQKISFAL